MSILKDSFKKFWNNCKTQGLASTTEAGLMSAEDKAILNGVNFGGICVGANVDFPTKATSFTVNTFCNDINQTSQSDMRDKTVGCIRVADNYRAIKVSSDGSTLSFNVDNTNITIVGLRSSDNTLTISNPTGLTISEIRMFLI